MEVETTPVTNLMSTDLVTTTADATAVTAAETLLEENVGSLLVFQAGELAGVVTSTDLIELVSAGPVSTDGTVSEYMTADVVTIDATDSIHDAAVTMIREDIQHLPVTGDGGDIVGMVSATDMTAQMTYILSSGAD